MVNVQRSIRFENTWLIRPSEFLRIEVNYVLIIPYLWRNYWNFFIYVYITTIQYTSYFCQTIFINSMQFFHQKWEIFLITGLYLSLFAYQNIFNSNLIFFQFSLISTIVECAAESSIHGCLINDDSVLNIIARIAHDCNTGVMPSRQSIVID